MIKRPPRDETQHQAEPEIIPPVRPDRPSTRGARVRISIVSRGGQARFGRLALFGIILALLLLLGMVTVILLAILMGVFLIWIPVVGALIAALVLWRFVRRQ